MRSDGSVWGVVGVIYVGDEVVCLLHWFSRHAPARTFIIKLLRRLIFEGMYELYSESAVF